MSYYQPPRLHQNQPPPQQPTAAVLRSREYYERCAFDANIFGCLLFLVLGNITHSLPQLAMAVAFAGSWIYGVNIPSAKLHRFLLVTVLLVATSFYVLGLHAIR